LARLVLASGAVAWTMPEMKKRFALALLLSCTVTAVPAAQPRKSGSSTEPAVRSYRWTDENGEVHYGDTVPAQYAQRSIAELNSQGLAVRERPAQLSAAEQALISERGQLDARTKQRDNFLLTTYTSTQDIESLRDERLAQIETQVAASRGYVEAVQTRMQGLKTRMRNFKPYSTKPNARRLPDTLTAEIVQTLNEELSQRAVLMSRQKEQETLRSSFQADIDRYRQLVVQQSKR